MGRRRTPQSRGVQLVVHRFAQEHRTRRSSVAIGPHPPTLFARSRKGFAASRSGLVNGKRDHGTPCGLGPFDESLGHRPFRGWVELIPYRRAKGGGHVLNRDGGVGRK